MGKYTLALLCALALLSGCAETDIGEQESLRNGYTPVYSTPDASDIVLASARPVERPGKIYIYGKYLLVGERMKGIHIFDNTDPNNPSPVGFIQMLGNSDMAIKDGVMYADHVGNLVALAISDFQTLDEKGRLPLRNWDKGVPPPSASYFVCYDPSKGIVVDWKPVKSSKFECYAH